MQEKFRITQCSRGFSMIELMIALALGLLLVEGIFVLFYQTHRVNSTQSALGHLQETGRIAISVIADDLRAAGQMPCGTRIRPVVFTNDLAAHISGESVAAAPSVDFPETQPYRFDFANFLAGHRCDSDTCTPVLGGSAGLPGAGIGDGMRIAGTDIVSVRKFVGSGWGVSIQGAPACSAIVPVLTFSLQRRAGETDGATFPAGHAALLANCTTAEIFNAVGAGSTISPRPEGRGNPGCMNIDGRTRLLDVDTQLQTSTFYLAGRVRDGELVPVLLRKSNNTTDEIAEGVERLDFRYSLVDSGGLAWWLTADEVARGSARDGARLRCDDSSGALHDCSWGDVAAIDIRMLVNSVDAAPGGGASNAFDYRYSADGDSMQRPASTMPVTGLKAKQLLRREFHTVVRLQGRAS